MIGLPPLPFDVKATVTELEPRVTLVIDGPAGLVPTMNELDAADAALFAIELLATTVHVYVRPFESELIVMGEPGPLVERDRPPLLERQVTL